MDLRNPAMPILKSGPGNAPEWCEMEDFQILDLRSGEAKDLVRSSAKEHYICTRGKVAVSCGPASAVLEEGGKFDAESGETVALKAVEDCQVFRAMGRWESITSSGIFRSNNGEPPAHDSPYDYEKTTTFDNHYHDCDEYWIILEGECTVATEGRLYDVGPGDNVATGMGWRHDVLKCKSDQGIKAIWFEGGLEGRKRTGHLWTPTHGAAEPKRDRV